MRAVPAPALAQALQDSHDDLRQARFGAAVSRLKSLLATKHAPAEAALLLARAELKRGAPGAGLEVLTRYAHLLDTRHLKAHAALLRGMAFARLDDAASARAQFAAASKLLTKTDDLQAELTYQIAAAQWIARDLDAATKTLAKLPAAIEPDLDLQARILRGAIASARERLPAQGAILLDALHTLGRNPNVGMHAYSVLVTQISALAVELPSSALRDAALDAIETVEWTADTVDLHFHAVRALAWRHALDGDEFNAFRRLKEAMLVARTPAWRVAALADRAYLADALGERRWSAQELRDAHELARTIDWNTIEGEEKLALPVLAQLFASKDPALAIHYASTFASVGKNYARILSSNNDRRVRALEAYSLGIVQRELGERAEAVRLFKEAWTIYDHYGISWRAARCALALSELDERAIWERRAAHAMAEYPRIWMARGRAPGAGGIAPIPSPELKKLTAAQRAVFDLILDGRDPEQIARAVGRSVYTVRNHIKAIYKAFGVTSRPALIVKASGG